MTEEELAQTERSLNRLLKEQAELRAEIDNGRQLEAAVIAAMSTLERTSVFSRRVREVEAANERYQESQRVVDQARRIAAALVEQREVLRQRIDALKDEVANAQVQVTRASERVSEISAATSMIAVHISETDTECPLCHSVFPKGMFQTLIRASTGQGDQVLATAQQSLSKKSQELQRAEVDLRCLVERQEKLQVDIRNAEDRGARAGSIVTSADIVSVAKAMLSRNWSLSSELRSYVRTSSSLEPREDHASYIATWLNVLAQNNRAVFTAAAHAQRAAECLNRTIAENAAQVPVTCAT